MSEEQENKEPKEEKKSDDSGTKSATIDDVKNIVKEAIEDIKSTFTGDSSSDSGTDKDGTDTEGDREKDSGPRSQFGQSLAAKEAEAESKLKAAVAGILEEREHKKEHDEIKKVKQEVQKAPVKVRRLTKLMLGKDFDYEK